jgi:hypothetical protein
LIFSYKIEEKEVEKKFTLNKPKELIFKNIE